MLNIELKARCGDLGKLRERCEALGAERQEPERQIDTYFKVPRGRLKLRESLESGAELIHYTRADIVGVRESYYETCRVEDTEALKAILTGALGVQAVVAKRREVFVTGSVRIHLDKVQGLGTFVEVEGMVADPAELAVVSDEVRAVQQSLGIDNQALVKESYADLISMADVARELRAG